MFTVRTIFPEQQRVETLNYELEPTNDHGKAVCALLFEFLSGQPPEFRSRLPFLKKGDTEMEWMAGGGAALLTFYEQGEPLSMGILLSGLQGESDAQMLEALRQAVLEPVFGAEAEKFLQAPERPLLLNVIFPGNAELIPRTQLLSAAVASVFFRTLLARQPSAGASPAGPKAADY
ncbi:MAG: hypothetical protein NZV14_03490 [Bryobacteraceae bacterium]|nr:hypothetical protein [Bryobacteraceae bacterium]MDW8377200.1 hypothetical protein [Bryobacterales bacterium]